MASKRNDRRNVVAVAWANGRVELKSQLPEGAVLLCRGPRTAVRDLMETVCRHAYRQVRGRPVLLVPGVPEAKSQRDAATALIAWWLWVSRSAPEGVVFSRLEAR